MFYSVGTGGKRKAHHRWRQLQVSLFPPFSLTGLLLLLLFLPTPPLPTSSSFSPPLPPPSSFLPVFAQRSQLLTEHLCFLSPLLPLALALVGASRAWLAQSASIIPLYFHFVPSCFLYLGVLHLSTCSPKWTKRILIVSAYLPFARRKEGSPLLWTMDRVREGFMGYRNIAA